MRLNRSMKWVVVLAMMASASVGMAAEASVSLDVASAYVFRGATFNDGLVAQPGLEVSGLPVTVGVWGNFDSGDYDETLEENEFSEVDIYASYDIPVEAVALSVGYTEYLYPGAEAVADREVSLSAGLDVALAPSVAVYYGVDGGIEDSLYAEAGIEHEFTVGEDLGVELGATVGYMDVDGGEAGFSHYTASVGASYGCVGASVTYIGEMDDDILGDAYDVDVVGMLSVGHDF
ncbi:MAG: hypothetical protein ISS31_03345 [Kiritimatiellae bacterium]|nr:hypothetical protein [Kiritimatiellia bacterium]